MLFRQHVEKEFLGTYLISLCKFFYEQQRNQLGDILREKPSDAEPDKQNTQRIVYQCRHCSTIYDDIVGDAENGIAPNTPFSQVPDSFHCQLCDAGKAAFVAVAESSLQLQQT